MHLADFREFNLNSISLRVVRKECVSIRSMTHEDVAPATFNVPESSLSLTVLCHRWTMTYNKTVMMPLENDPFLIHRPGARISLMQSFRVSAVYTYLHYYILYRDERTLIFII